MLHRLDGSAWHPAGMSRGGERQPAYRAFLAASAWVLEILGAILLGNG